MKRRKKKMKKKMMLLLLLLHLLLRVEEEGEGGVQVGWRGAWATFFHSSSARL